MIQVCEYNPVADMREVVPNLAINIREIIESNVVPNTGVEPLYNGLDEISKVGERVSDNFEAFDAMNRHREYMSRVQSGNKKGGSNAPEPPVTKTE